VAVNKRTGLAAKWLAKTPRPSIFGFEELAIVWGVHPFFDAANEFALLDWFGVINRVNTDKYLLHVVDKPTSNSRRSIWNAIHIKVAILPVDPQHAWTTIEPLMATELGGREFAKSVKELNMSISGRKLAPFLFNARFRLCSIDTCRSLFVSPWDPPPWGGGEGEGWQCVSTRNSLLVRERLNTSGGMQYWATTSSTSEGTSQSPGPGLPARVVCATNEVFASAVCVLTESDVDDMARTETWELTKI
jgi:hypothetical protein